MGKYSLNLAAEYQVCAEMLRSGSQASVTLGNLKGADIHIVTAAGDRCIIVVEGKGTDSNRFVTRFIRMGTATEMHMTVGFLVTAVWNCMLTA